MLGLSTAEGNANRERTALYLDPGRGGALTLDNPVHKELFTRDERVVFFRSALERLPTARKIGEPTLHARFLDANLF